MDFTCLPPALTNMLASTVMDLPVSWTFQENQGSYTVKLVWKKPSPKVTDEVKDRPKHKKYKSPSTLRRNKSRRRKKYGGPATTQPGAEPAMESEPTHSAQEPQPGSLPAESTNLTTTDLHTDLQPERTHEEEPVYRPTMEWKYNPSPLTEKPVYQPSGIPEYSPSIPSDSDRRLPKIEISDWVNKKGVTKRGKFYVLLGSQYYSAIITKHRKANNQNLVTVAVRPRTCLGNMVYIDPNMQESFLGVYEEFSEYSESKESFCHLHHYHRFIEEIIKQKTFFTPQSFAF